LTREEFLEATRSAPVVVANFVKAGQAHPLVTRAAEQIAEANASVEVIEFDLDGLSDLVDEYMAEMDPYSGTLSFEFPGLALFRDGELITTFQPWLNLATDRLNEEGVERQLKVFLQRLAADAFQWES